uniref:Uncharacterized protein n=1 Tax=Accipiter nisus TaxID=211598 RepID=A0A8B9M7C1_9AVES
MFFYVKLLVLCSEGNQQSDEEFVGHFSAKVETVIHVVLYAIQCLVERKQEDGKEEEKSLEESGKFDAASFDLIKAGHITKLLDEDLSADLDSLHVQKAILAVSELLQNLKSYGEDYTSNKHKFFNQFCYLLVRLKPMLCKYSDLILFYLTVSLASHRSTGKLLSVLTSIFTELAQKVKNTVSCHCGGFGMKGDDSSCSKLTYRHILKLVTGFLKLLKINRTLENMAVVNVKTWLTKLLLTYKQ